MKQKIELNYSFACTVQSLFRAISTPDGLSDWFADKVDVNGNIYTFYWNKAPHKAIMLAKKENSFIRFHWVDDEEEIFELKIIKSEMTADNSLVISDLVDVDDVEGAISLWNNQIEKLKRAIGCPKN